MPACWVELPERCPSFEDLHPIRTRTIRCPMRPRQQAKGIPCGSKPRVISFWASTRSVPSRARLCKTPRRRRSPAYCQPPPPQIQPRQTLTKPSPQNIQSAHPRRKQSLPWEAGRQPHHHLFTASTEPREKQGPLHISSPPPQQACWPLKQGHHAERRTRKNLRETRRL